jgi:hypothetical protein
MGAELGSCGAPGGARTCNLLSREVSAPSDEAGRVRFQRVRSGCRVRPNEIGSVWLRSVE